MSDFLTHEARRQADLRSGLTEEGRSLPSPSRDGLPPRAGKRADMERSYVNGPSAEEHIAAALAGGIIASKNSTVSAEEAVAIYDKVLTVLRARDSGSYEQNT